MPKRGNTRSAKRASAKPADGRRARGQKVFAAIHKDAGRQVVARLRTISPDFADMIIDFGFGEIYARPGLDLRSRQIATVAALTALNNAPQQLQAHMQGALNLGITREEIFEIVIQMALYGGFAAAANGLVVAQAAFASEETTA